MIYDKKNVRVLTAAALLSCAAGLTNGFLGAGGGIILFWLLKKLYPTADPSAVRDNFATVVLCVLLLSTVSAVSYSHKGSVDTSALSEVVIPGILGGVTGAYLTDRLNTSILKIAFAVIMIIGGINML